MHAHKGDSIRHARLEQLKDDVAAGLIDEEAFNGENQDILSEF